MGDLIQRLPTDENGLSPDEQQNLLLLFGKEEEEPVKQSSSSSFQQSVPIMTTQLRNTRPPQTEQAVNLKKEFIQVCILSAVFFVFNFAVVDTLLNKYVPLCSSSSLIRNVAKSVVFGIILWVLINHKYIN